MFHLKLTDEELALVREALEHTLRDPQQEETEAKKMERLLYSLNRIYFAGNKERG